MEGIKEALHRSVPFFEDIPRYPAKDLVKLHGLRRELIQEKDPVRQESLLISFIQAMNGLEEIDNPPERIYLWPEGSMPESRRYTENPGLRYQHDPDFRPYFYEFLIPREEAPKGAVILCAGGDHGDCVIHEAYQSCLDLNRLGYQCFMLLNRTNHMPYLGTECGADAARAVRLIRANAEKYRIEPDRVAFAGISNGGLTGEECIRYYSGTKKVSDYFPEYREDAFDAFYGAPDVFLCVYGPRWEGEKIDYEGVVYPPTLFAVGMDDKALDNLHYVYRDLLEHGIRAEVHTFWGVPHGQAGVSIFGNRDYANFDQWLTLSDAFMQKVYQEKAEKKDRA